MALASFRHDDFRRRGIIESAVTPGCGYFVFEKLNIKLPPGNITADGRYFGQPRYPDHIKINLPSPAIDFLWAGSPPERT
jgi:hypothetical protein